MFSLSFRRSRPDGTIAAVYGAIVAQARERAFYADYGVPDTVEGRFDMIVLHLVLALRRLQAGPSGAAAIGQGLVDRFCADMDDNFREMGVGDLAVPKRMRKVAEAFRGRARVYDRALAPGADAAALSAALARNVFGREDASVPGVRHLAAYMRRADGELAARSEAELSGDLARGVLRFPDPGAMAEPAAAHSEHSDGHRATPPAGAAP